ncbi:hypothetical protein LSUB1_G004422 [Lachnellula subtilissima]|uniref:Uncharacterized protein n=1 Tax=Lachnellula subtilissima TaxID=602034 RepID=A0A8H8UB28_9HELO|nr:hypothetical protein LSUB1_G004422 [Lachnellula subtilissima]
MSVFSKISLSRKAAKEHKAKVAEKDTDVKVPYKHVPTHAAVDALNGAPSTWKIDDRPKIKEQHKRRSHMPNTRTTSALSIATTSHLNSARPSTGLAPLPRSSSYNNYNPAWFDRGVDSYTTHEPVQKRYKPSRGHSYHDPGVGPSAGPSPLASNMHSEDVTPALSSGNSDTSDSSDNLEISVAPNQNYHIPQRPVSIRTGAHSQSTNRMSLPQGTVFPEKDIFSRLHTSTTRKLGEAPLYDSPPIVTKPPTAAVSPVEQTSKKSRWSLLGKKPNANTVA